MQMTAGTDPVACLYSLGQALRRRGVRARPSASNVPARLVVSGLGGRRTILVRCLRRESELWFLMQVGEQVQWLHSDLQTAADLLAAEAERQPSWPPIADRNRWDDTYVIGRLNGGTDASAIAG